MKNLLFACASLALISSANAAGDGVDHKVNGELRVRYHSINAGDFTDSGTDTKWFQRTRLGYTLMKGDDLTFHAGLLAHRRWGVDQGAATLAGDTTQPGRDDGSNDISLHEANVTWKAMDNLAVKIGRGALDVADGRVISRNDYFQSPYAFDGMAAMYFAEMANVTAFGVRAVDSGLNTTAPTNNDDVWTADDPGTNIETNFYGVSVDFKNLPEVLKMVNVHLLQQKTFNLTTNADEKLRYGLTVGGDVSGFDYNLTYAGYKGETTPDTGSSIDKNAWMLDLTAGYTLADMMGLRIHGNYHTDTGDKDGNGGNEDETYDPFYYNQHDSAGMMDLLTWGNLTYWKLGVSLMPMEMLTVGLDYYDFSLTEKVDATGNNKSLANGTAIVDEKEDIGQEFDLWAKRSLSNGAEFMLRYSQFMAEKDSIGSPAEDKITEIFAQATFSF